MNSRYRYIGLPILLIAGLFSSHLFAQNFTFLDARSKGLAGISVTPSSSAYIFLNNPANLVSYRRPVFSIDVNQFFNYDQVAIADLFPRVGVMGLAVGRMMDYGGTDFLSLGIGRSFKYGVDMGISNIVFSNNNDFTNSWIFGVSFKPEMVLKSSSARIAFFKKFDFAASLQNATFTKKRLGPPLKFNFGFHCRVLPNLIDLFAEYQTVRKDNSFIVASELHTSSFLTLRAGMADFDKNNLLFGFGLNFKNFLLDIVYNKYIEQFQLSGTIHFGVSPHIRAAQYYAIGNDYLNKKYIKAALKVFRKAIDYDPLNKIYQDRLEKTEELYWELKLQETRLLQEADKYEQQGEYLAALVRYMDVVDRFPENTRSKRKVAYLKPLARFQFDDVKKRAIDYYESGDLKYAKQIFGRLARIDAKDSTVIHYQNRIREDIRKKAQQLYNTGIGYLGQQRYENAYVFFKRILDLVPDYPQVKEFIDDIERKIEKKNKQIDSLFVLAQKSENSSEFESAIEIYDEILKIDDENEKAVKALAILKPRVDIHVSTLLTQAQNAFKNKNFKETESICRNILRIDRENRDALNLLNRSRRTRLKTAENLFQESDKLVRQKKYNQAVIKIKQAITLNPGEQKYKRSLKTAEDLQKAEDMWQEANGLYKSKNFRDAEKNLLDLIEKYPEVKKYQEFFQKVSLDKARFATILLQEGIRLYSLERYDQAVNKFKQILEIDPNNQNAKQYKEITEEKIKALKKLK